MSDATKLRRAIAAFPTEGHDDHLDALVFPVQFQQSRLVSLIEACFNTAWGFAIGLFAQVIVFPIVGIRADWHQNLAVSIIFTAISIARTYVTRRLFNGPLHRLAMRLAAWIES